MATKNKAEPAAPAQRETRLARLQRELYEAMLEEQKRIQKRYDAKVEALTRAEHTLGVAQARVQKIKAELDALATEAADQGMPGVSERLVDDNVTSLDDEPEEDTP